MKIKEALFKLNDFCNANRIEYMVTGTTALAMLGVPSNPQDIDIKVFHLKEEQEAKLKELQFLSGLENEYNKELMDKHGINASNPKLSKIGAIMADAFEKEGVYSLISPEVENRLARAVETAAKELVKMM